MYHFRTVLRRLLLALPLITVIGLPVTAAAQESTTPSIALINDRVIQDIRTFLGNEVVSLSLKAANKRRSGISQEEILSLDAQWRKERDADGAQPLIATALGSPVSTYLLRVQSASGGLYSEIFVMDANGLNVGQSTVTSDYWQGDEAKVQKTFDVGAGVVFIDEAEYNSERGIWVAQVNLTLDSAGEPVGSGTIEINLTELQRRRALGLS